MIDFILEIDTVVFYFINVTLSNPVFDWFMPFITEKKHWFPVWGILIVGLLWKGGKKGRTAVFLIIPVIFLSDQLSAHVLKPLIARPRPCVTLPDVHLLVGMKTSLSFPSAHAANFFAVATYFNYFYPKYRWVYFSAALLVALSRISIGVHYPLDIIAGGILGAACALFVIYTWRAVMKIIDKKRKT
ncbi:MAG: phosphatase PAP2 family protein [Calditrichia bacterium]|nr:phosphatase PAP2 family protein [Calditrichia bacterium]